MERNMNKTDKTNKTIISLRDYITSKWECRLKRLMRLITREFLEESKFSTGNQGLYFQWKSPKNLKNEMFTL